MLVQSLIEENPPLDQGGVSVRHEEFLVAYSKWRQGILVFDDLSVDREEEV